MPELKTYFTTISAAALLPGIVAFSVPADAWAEKIFHTSKFNINYGGLRIGKATFNITIDGNDYNLSAHGSTDGVARLFSKGKGSFESNGHIKKDTVISTDHTVEVTEKGKTAKLNMSFIDGDLDKVSITPEKKKKKGKKYVPVLDSHLKSIIDPASSLVVPVSEEKTSGKHVCGRTLNVFDGETRFDMKVSYKSTRPISTDGYKGLAYVCKLKYVPIAGHREGHKSVELMRKNEQMEIWMAPISGTYVFTPIKIDVGSQIGRFVAYPQQFSAVVK